MTEDQGRDERHAGRMLRKKSVIDGKIAAAQEERGVLVVNTGNGKGKSSAAFGVVARALGHGMKVAVIQFVKNRSDTVTEMAPVKHAFKAGVKAMPGIEW